MTEVSENSQCMTRDSPGSACHRINGTFTLVKSYKWYDETCANTERFYLDYVGQYVLLEIFGIQQVS